MNDERIVSDGIAGLPNLAGLDQGGASAQAVADTRACTCNPNDNPPKPCPRKFALSECEAAAGVMGPDLKQELLKANERLGEALKKLDDRLGSTDGVPACLCGQPISDQCRASGCRWEKEKKHV